MLKLGVLKNKSLVDIYFECIHFLELRSYVADASVQTT